MIRNYFVFTILAGGVFLAAATPLLADGGAFDKTYGNGVHAFFASDYAKAHECLSRAIDAKSEDPRCFYFRGLAYLKLGREPEAHGDFAAAADLEAGDACKFYNVSKALQRVQGKSRLAIEQYRAKARLKATAREAKLRRARYEELRDAETRVLQQQAKAAPAKSVPVETAKSDDPFTAGPFEDEAPKAAAKAAAEKPAAKSADPFAVKPKKPAAKPPVAKKGGGILGAIGKAAASSLPKFGGKTDGKDDGPVKPQTIVTPPPADDDGPFGAGAPAPAPQTPAADDDDPFGASAPAPKPATPKAPAPRAEKPAPEPATPAAPADDEEDPFA